MEGRSGGAAHNAQPRRGCRWPVRQTLCIAHCSTTPWNASSVLPASQLRWGCEGCGRVGGQGRAPPGGSRATTAVGVVEVVSRGGGQRKGRGEGQEAAAHLREECVAGWGASCSSWLGAQRRGAQRRRMAGSRLQQHLTSLPLASILLLQAGKKVRQGRRQEGRAGAGQGQAGANLRQAGGQAGGRAGPAPPGRGCTAQPIQLQSNPIALPPTNPPHPPTREKRWRFRMQSRSRKAVEHVRDAAVRDAAGQEPHCSCRARGACRGECSGRQCQARARARARARLCTQVGRVWRGRQQAGRAAGQAAVRPGSGGPPGGQRLPGQAGLPLWAPEGGFNSQAATFTTIGGQPVWGARSMAAALETEGPWDLALRGALNTILGRPRLLRENLL